MYIQLQIVFSEMFEKVVESAFLELHQIWLDKAQSKLIFGDGLE